MGSVKYLKFQKIYKGCWLVVTIGAMDTGKTNYYELMQFEKY